jgi:hypothetical protein
MSEQLLGKTADSIYNLRLLTKDEFEEVFPFRTGLVKVLGAAIWLVQSGKGHLRLEKVTISGGSMWQSYDMWCVGGYEKVEVFVPGKRAQAQLEIEYGMCALLVD